MVLVFVGWNFVNARCCLFGICNFCVCIVPLRCLKLVAFDLLLNAVLLGCLVCLCCLG